MDGWLRLPFEPLVFARFVDSHGPSGWGPWGRFPVMGRADPGVPIRRSAATINSASVVIPAAVAWRIHGPRRNPQRARTMPVTGLYREPCDSK